MVFFSLGYTIIRPCKWTYLFATCIGMLSSYIGAHNQSYLTKTLVSSDSMSALIPLLTWNIIGGICGSLRGLIYTQINQRMYDKLSTAVFDRIQSATMETWDVEWKETALTKTIMTDLYNVIQAVSLLWNVTMRTITTIICASYLWYTISPRLFYKGIMISLLHFISFHIVQPWYERMSTAARLQKEAAETCMNEYVQQHTNIMLYEWQNMYKTTYHTIMQCYKATTYPESYAYAFVLFTSQVLPRCGEIYLIIDSDISFVLLFEVISYYRMITDSLNACKEQLISSYKQRTAMEHIWNILQKPIREKPQKIESSIALSEPICFHEITFRYPTSSIPIFQQFSLTIQPGECVILCAKSGKGKTTLIKLVMGLYSIESGRITPNDISSKISIVPQDPWYDPQRTLRENIVMGLSPAMVLPTDLLERVHLTELNDRLDQRLVSISGGQKQRVALARILLRNTPIIILDEPTTALNIELEQSMIELVLKHVKGKTIIWITHHAELLPNTMRVVYI